MQRDAYIESYDAQLATPEPVDHCDGHHKPNDGSWWEHDARGIPLCRVCMICKPVKLAKYRPEVLDDSNYEADEPIEPEDEAW